MKTLYKILISAVIILIIAVSSIPWVLGPLVKSRIAKFSGNKIFFEYSNSHTNLFTRTILFDSVKLLFDNVYYDSASAILLNKLSFNVFSMEGLNISDLLFNKKLKFHKLLMDSPALWLSKNHSIYKKEISNHHTLLKMLAEGTSKKNTTGLHFQIDEFEIKKGGFTYKDKDNREISIENLSLLVTNLQHSNFKAREYDMDRLFDFKARLELEGVENITDNYYKTRVERLILDTRLQEIKIKGVDLTPLKKPDSANPVMYKLTGGNFHIEGVNLKDILQKKEFHLKNIKIGNASITEFDRNNRESLNESPAKKTDTSILFSFFNEYKIDSVRLNNTTFQSLNGTDTSKLFRFGDFTLGNIQLDSISFSGITNNNLIKNLSVSSRTVYARLAGPGLEFSYDNFEYNGKDSTIHFGNLAVSALCSPTDNDTIAKCDIKIGSATFLNMTPEVLFSGDEKAISVHISNWTANISNFSKINFNEISDTSFRLSEKLNFDIVELKDGNIKITDADSAVLNINKVNLSTNGLRVFTNSEKHPELVNYKEIKAEFIGLDLRPQQGLSLNINNCNLNNCNLNISGINLVNNKINNTDISLREFAISGFDTKALINRKEFIAKNITLSKPDIIHTINKPAVRHQSDSLNFKILRQKIARGIEKKLSKLKIDNLTLLSGDININNNENETNFKSSFGLCIENINFNKYVKKFSNEIAVGNIKVNLNNSNVRLKDISMKYDSVIIDTKDDRISFINSFLLSLPDKTITENKNSEMHAFIPRIDITGPDFNAYLYHPMSFSSMVIEKPNFNLLIHSKKENSKKGKPLTDDIPFSYFKDYIRLNDGKINITVESGTDTLKVKVNNISATWYENVPKPASGVSFSASEQMHKADVTIAGLSLTSNKTEISIDKVRHNVNGTEIRIKGFKQSSYKLQKQKKELANKVLIPSILIENPVLHKRMGKLANIDFKKIITGDVDVDLFQLQENAAPSKHFNFKDTTLRPVFNYLGHFTTEYTKIGNLHFQYFPKEKDKKPVDITRMSIIVKGLSIDSSLFTSHSSIINDMDITFYKREMVTKSGLYLIRSNNVTYSYKQNRLILDSVYLTPRYGRKEFFKKAVYQTDRISLKGKNIIIDGIDFESILTDRIYHIDRVSLNGFMMISHRDKRYERKPGVIKPMPQTALRNLPFKIAIDSLYVNKSYILYGEYVDQSQKPGEVYFTDFNIKAGNITNVGKNIERDPVMEVMMSTQLMGDASLTLGVKFILNDPSDYFEYSGHLNSFDLRKMNSMAENLLGLTIKSGKGTLDINDVSGNNDVAKGKLYFKYKNLKVGLYNRNKAKEVTGILGPLVSFVVNDLTLRSNNPKSFGKPKLGDVYFERDANKSILNYLWKSTMSGLLTTIGINNKQQKEAEKNARKALKNDQKINKEFEKSLKDLDLNK